MYLEDIYVEPDMRGNGIGMALFEKLIDKARAEKLNGITWQALEWNEPAINFYCKLGAEIDAEWLNCSLEL